MRKHYFDMHLLCTWIDFDMVATAIHCLANGPVMQLLNCYLVTSVFSWCYLVPRVLN